MSIGQNRILYASDHEKTQVPRKINKLDLKLFTMGDALIKRVSCYTISEQQQKQPGHL